jgi:hypothetical protein
MNTTIPVEIASILLPFAALFTKPVWGHAQTLLMGAILTTGKRTITSVLVVMGLNQEEHFHALSSRIKLAASLARRFPAGNNTQRQYGQVCKQAEFY